MGLLDVQEHIQPHVQRSTLTDPPCNRELERPFYGGGDSWGHALVTTTDGCKFIAFDQQVLITPDGTKRIYFPEVSSIHDWTGHPPLIIDDLQSKVRTTVLAPQRMGTLYDISRNGEKLLLNADYPEKVCTLDLKTLAVECFLGAEYEWYATIGTTPLFQQKYEIKSCRFASDDGNKIALTIHNNTAVPHEQTEYVFDLKVRAVAVREIAQR